jgi:hypothetical protein
VRNQFAYTDFCNAVCIKTEGVIVHADKVHCYVHFVWARCAKIESVLVGETAILHKYAWIDPGLFCLWHYLILRELDDSFSVARALHEEALADIVRNLHNGCLGNT